MNAIPKRLKQEPLIEAIWQVQFETPEVGDVLPGVLFTELRKRHPALKLRRLPAADIPAPIAQADPRLRFVAKVLMEEPDSPFIWQVGDRVVTLNCRKPYAGWEAFKDSIEALINNLRNSGLVSQIQHHSLHYLDLLTLDPAPDISALKLNVQMGHYKIVQSNLQMRLEILVDQCVHVIQIVTPANANLPEGVQTGTLVDLETRLENPPVDWDDALGQLEKLHTQSKDIFFRHILKDETIQKLEPEY